MANRYLRLAAPVRAADPFRYCANRFGALTKFTSRKSLRALLSAVWWLGELLDSVNLSKGKA